MNFDEFRSLARMSLSCGAPRGNFVGLKFGTWLVETIALFVSSNRTSNLFVTGRFRKILVEKKIRDMVTRFGP